MMRCFSFLSLLTLLLTVIACEDEPNTTRSDTSQITADATQDSNTVSNDVAGRDSASADTVLADSGQADVPGTDTDGLEDTTQADTSPTDTAAQDTTVQDTGSGTDGDTCNDAIDVTSGGILADQSTVSATDDYETGLGNSGCPVGRFTGGDRVYSVSPSTTTNYRILVEPNEIDFDPMIYVRLDCSQDACVDGTVLNGAGTQEQLDVTINGGQTAFIIIDGETISSGTYTLTITLL